MSSPASRLNHLRREGGFFVLGMRTRIRVTGADRLRYLNGQLSNDLRRLVQGEAMPALLLSAKGKLCADVFVWPDGDSLIVEADVSLEESLLARLDRYAVADDVAFEVMPADPQRCHLFGSAPSHGEGIRIQRMGVPGIDLPFAPEELLEAGGEEIEVLRIERGIPCWGRELSEDTLPQEARLDRLAVDFKKGCYVGQEVVSRIHSVGRVNRLLTGFIGALNPTPAKGTTLLDSSGQKVGRLTSAAFHPELQKTISLGFLQTNASNLSFSVVDESGACLGEVERSEFPLVSS
ncbi:MAG TPA: hypothetical protein VIT23_01670 [Terrimicrobiaceae bacterium]